MKQRPLTRLLGALLLGVAVYGVFVAWSGWQATRESLTHFAWTSFLATLALATFNYLLRFWKWQYYLARLGVHGVPPRDSFLVFLSGFVLTVTPGKVGEVFKSAVLAETHGIPVARTAPIVFAERLTDVVGVVVLILLGSIGFAGGLPWALAGLAAVTLGLCLVLWRAPLEALARRLEAGGPRARALAPRAREAIDSLRVVASPSALILPSLLSVVAWGAEGFGLWVLTRGFGTPAPLALAVFAYATATLAGALVPVPGGLGVAEAMLKVQLVGLAGLPEGVSTSSMIMIRFATLWWAVLVGFFALGLLRRRFPTLLR